MSNAASSSPSISSGTASELYSHPPLSLCHSLFFSLSHLLSPRILSSIQKGWNRTPPLLRAGPVLYSPTFSTALRVHFILRLELDSTIGIVVNLNETNKVEHSTWDEPHYIPHVRNWSHSPIPAWTDLPLPSNIGGLVGSAPLTIAAWLSFFTSRPFLMHRCNPFISLFYFFRP